MQEQATGKWSGTYLQKVTENAKKKAEPETLAELIMEMEAQQKAKAEAEAAPVDPAAIIQAGRPAGQDTVEVNVLSAGTGPPGFSPFAFIQSRGARGESGPTRAGDADAAGGSVEVVDQEMRMAQEIMNWSKTYEPLTIDLDDYMLIRDLAEHVAQFTPARRAMVKEFYDKYKIFECTWRKARAKAKAAAKAKPKAKAV